MTIQLRCEKLRKSFGGVEALCGVSVEFNGPGITGIIGPNGAGKTTLLNMLSGFMRPDAGRCFVRNQEITGFSPEDIVALGVVRTFQEVRVVRRLPVWENVLLARPGQRGETLWGAFTRIGVALQEETNEAKAAEILALVGLHGKGKVRAGELSYGEQKLLSLATGLATGANIFLLDEPVSGVHPRRVNEITQVLRKLAVSGRLIVFIEHDIGVVREIADHLVVMDDGRVIAEGHPEDVLKRKEIVEAYVA